MEKESFERTIENASSDRCENAIFDENGWADEKRHYPIPFDMVIVDTKTKKNIRAWWGVNEWFGFRLKKTDEVIRWKKIIYGSNDI